MRRFSRRLLIVFDLRPAELWPVRMLWFFAFFQGAGLAYFITAASTLFLATLDVQTLPWLFIAAACLNIVVGRAFVFLEHRLTHAKLLLLSVAVLAASALLFRIGLTYSNAVWIVLAMFTWTRVLQLLSQLQFWGISATLFDVRQSKRIFSLIDSGGFLAKIAGYFSAAFLVERISVENLPLLAFFLFVASVYCLTRITTRYHDRLSGAHTSAGIQVAANAHDHKGHGFLSELKHDSFLRVVALLSFFAVLAMTSIDYGFLSEVEHKYTEKSQIAMFLGLFFGAGKVLSFLYKTLFSGRMFTRFGIARSIAVLPIVLLAILIISLSTHALQTWDEVVYIGLFSLCMLLVEIWGEGVQVPALAISFQPLTLKKRLEAHNLMLGKVEPIALGSAGVILLALVSTGNFGLTALSMVLIIPLLLWVWYSLAMGKEYGVMVEKSLKRRSLETNTLEWDDALRTVIKRSLKSEHEDEIVYALRLIPQSDHKFFLEFGVPLLEHVSASVCMEVISRIESTHWETHPRERLKLIVQNLFGRELRPELKGALIQCYLALTNVGDQAVIDEWLEDSNNNTRKGAIVGLLRYRGTDGALNAEKHLLILSQAIDPSSRALAAEIIGNVGIRTFEQPLVDLLHDSDDNVVTTALAAAENVRHPHLLPVVFELVMAPNRSRQVYQSTAECLVAYGHDALPSLRKALFEMHPSAPQFERLVRVVSHIPGVASEEIVTQILHKPYVDPEIRFTALNALVQLRHDTSNSRESIEDLLTSEQVLVGALRSWLHAVSTSNQVTTTQQAKLIELLDRALKWELEQTRQRVLLILALLYDRKTLAKIKENLLYGSHDHRANALELLEHVLPNQTALKILPLFEDSTLALAAGTGKLNKKEFTGVLSSVLSSEWSIGEWTRIIAFEALKTLDTSDSQPVRVHTNIELLDQTKFPMLIERVMTLKTVDIFSETSDNILHYIASLLQEQRFDAGEMFIKKGEMGNCLYVIVEGKVRVHDGDHTLAYLSSRQVVGELSLLDPEPRSASVTTEVETLMLRLDQDDFFDLMADRIEIARAALSVLCKRIRNQNALLAAAHKEPVLDVATQILT